MCNPYIEFFVIAHCWKLKGNTTRILFLKIEIHSTEANGMTKTNTKNTVKQKGQLYVKKCT